MSLVYITNASLKRIVNDYKYDKKSKEYLLDDISREIAEDGVFTRDEIDYILNTGELENIHKIKMTLKDFSGVVDDIQKNKNLIDENVTSQNKKYVYKVKAPSYHFDKSCNWMHSNFTNVKIPQDCLDDTQNENIVREWVDENKQLSFQELNSLFMKKFNCSKGLEQVDIENSGSTNFENYKINFRTESKKCRLQLRFLLDGEFGKKIANYRYMPKYKLKELIDIPLNQPIIEFHEAKAKFEKIVISFYQNKYNVNLGFDKNLLDAIGFKACRGCHYV